MEGFLLAHRVYVLIYAERAGAFVWARSDEELRQAVRTYVGKDAPFYVAVVDPIQRVQEGDGCYWTASDGELARVECLKEADAGVGLAQRVFVHVG